MSKYAQFFAIINKNGFTVDEVIETVTRKKVGLSKLSPADFTEIMIFLKPYNKIPPGDRQRKKIIAIARQMQWGNGDLKETLKAIDAWLMKQKFRRPMMALMVDELNLMLAVLEQRVLTDYLTGLNK